MDADAIVEYLKRPPEEVRLAEIYPQLPQPIPFPEATAFSVWDEENDREYDEDDPPTHPPCYTVCFDIPQGSGFVSTDFAVTGHHHRIIGEYDVAQERQMDAEEACAKARWLKPPAPPPRPLEPEDVPPGGKLTARQEEFCRHYAAQPIATRAAILAGYAEENAAPYGSRLLNNPLVLDRIARLRAAQDIRYVVERDTMHDKLEALYFGALGERDHAAAVSALRLQAMLAGLLERKADRRQAKKSQGAAVEKAKKSQGRAVPEANESQGAAPRKPMKANESQ